MRIVDLQQQQHHHHINDTHTKCNTLDIPRLLRPTSWSSPAEVRRRHQHATQTNQLATTNTHTINHKNENVSSSLYSLLSCFLSNTVVLYSTVQARLRTNAVVAVTWNFNTFVALLCGTCTCSATWPSLTGAITFLSLHRRLLSDFLLRGFWILDVDLGFFSASSLSLFLTSCFVLLSSFDFLSLFDFFNVRTRFHCWIERFYIQ